MDKKKAKTKVTVGGKEYPCRITMGAMIRFKNEAGHDVSEMSKSDVGEMLTFVWSCVKSACNADKIDFDMSIQDFADQLSPNDLTSFYDSLGTDGEKKTMSAQPT